MENVEYLLDDILKAIRNQTNVISECSDQICEKLNEVLERKAEERYKFHHLSDEQLRELSEIASGKKHVEKIVGGVVN